MMSTINVCDVTICFTRSYESNKLVIDCLESLRKQKKINFEILFLDQNKNLELKKYCEEISKDGIYINYKKIKKISNSYSKNFALKIVKTKYLIFTDPDMRFDELWTYNLVKSIKNNNCIMIGGKILPLWEKKPLFISKSIFSNDIYSLYNIGNKEKFISKVFASNMLINLDLIKENDIFFDENLGRTKNSLVGREDIDFCEKISKKNFKIFYSPKAVSYHLIQKERISWKWVFKRAFSMGYMKNQRQNKKISPINKKYKFKDIIFISPLLFFYFLGIIYFYYFKFVTICDN